MFEFLYFHGQTNVPDSWAASMGTIHQNLHKQLPDRQVKHPASLGISGAKFCEMIARNATLQIPFNYNVHHCFQPVGTFWCDCVQWACLVLRHCAIHVSCMGLSNPGVIRAFWTVLILYKLYLYICVLEYLECIWLLFVLSGCATGTNKSTPFLQAEDAKISGRSLRRRVPTTTSASHDAYEDDMRPAELTSLCTAPGRREGRTWLWRYGRHVWVWACARARRSVCAFVESRTAPLIAKRLYISKNLSSWQCALSC